MTSFTADLPKQQPRRFGWKPDKPDVNDMILRPMAIHFEAIPPSGYFDVEFLPLIRDQGNQGSCTGHAARSAAQFLRRIGGQEELELSPRFIYWNGRVIEGTTKEDAGCEIRDVIKSMVKVGVSPEKFCPYGINNYKIGPSRTAYRHARKDMVKEYRRAPQSKMSLKVCVMQNIPVVFGFSVFENFDTGGVEQSGLLPMPKGKMIGGHAVWIVGFDDTMHVRGQQGAFLIANSYGKSWGCAHPLNLAGGRGYFWMPYEYVTSVGLSDDFWALKTIT